MKPFLMGTETEYAVSGRRNRFALNGEQVFNLLSDALRQERLWMTDVLGGRAMYLEHGGRFYMDHGFHPEYATPECTTPAQVAAYDKAGEQLLELARARVQREQPDVKLTLIKNNLDPVYPDYYTYGCHESYTSWVPSGDAVQALVPHLVSRVLYCGSGCLSARPGATGFELSQRARHLVEVTGNDTTGSRPIFCTRIRKVSDHSDEGWTRAHLIGKDSQRAPYGIYLTFATTGLLFQVLNRGRKAARLGQGLELVDPVEALHAISADPDLTVKVPLADGRRLSALEIQETYLEECQLAVQKGGLPDWANDALRHWEETLTALARHPLQLADRLDPYCKRLLFEGELRRAGYTWSELHRALAALTTLRMGYSEAVYKAVVSEDRRGLSEEDGVKYSEAVAATSADEAGTLDRLRFALRLQALDVSYHEIGGLHDWLTAFGKMHDVVLNPADVERATREAPPGGRAAQRSAAIRQHREADWVCDWQYLYQHSSGNCLDLRNPFDGQRRVVTLQQPDDPEQRVGVLQMLEATGAV
ncbi:MAG: proteasome accessory factor PafA2 family protein [Gemmataceae bacterium]|nr:proteasome accessory factor PafA2 family protein [Gemmataceae bacterium]